MRGAVSDVAVIGGGPGGSSVATHLARGGLSVTLLEREVFPRFKVGESLVPATMLLLERLGVLDRVERGGYQVKYGATFLDEETGLGHTFYFLRGMPWPNWTYNVPRADFDALLRPALILAGGARVSPSLARVRPHHVPWSARDRAP